MGLRNWAGNHVYRAARLHRPGSLEELREAVAGAPGRIRALGTRHSFNDIADAGADGDLVSLVRFDAVELDRDRRTVTVGAGVRYGELGRLLNAKGFALHNTASLPHISVAGACATATHGSGDGNGCLATAVSALEMVTAGGDVLTLSRDQDGERFAGAVVGLGALGVVTHLTLDLLPAFAVRQTVYEDLPLATALAHFDEVMAGAYSVSLFTDWREDRFHQVWLKRRVGDEEAEPPADWFGARPAAADVHPLPGMPAENCTPQRGEPGLWNERLPHFRPEFTPSAGAELQTEYLVPRENAVAALRAVAGMRGRIAPLLQVAEVRTVAADDLWMSPFYRQPCAGLHFTWVPDGPAVSALLPALEAELAPLGARPHWGKLSGMGGDALRPLFPRLPDFIDLVRTLDPGGKFRNGFLNDRLFVG